MQGTGTLKELTSLQKHYAEMNANIRPVTVCSGSEAASNEKRSDAESLVIGL